MFKRSCLDLEVVFLPWGGLLEEAVQNETLKWVFGSLWLRPLGCLNVALNFVLRGKSV